MPIAKEKTCMERSKEDRKFETILIHGAVTRREEGGATLPPLHFSTAFEHESAEFMEEVFADQQEAPNYSRLQNPTVERLEQRITDVCRARGTLAVASGMSAISLGLTALLKPGDELVASRYLFGGTYTLFDRTMREMGIETRFFDPRHPEAAEELITSRSKALFLEAIANPAMVVPDFSAYRKICRAKGLPLLVDATLITPYLLDAGALGADLAFFSATKYIAGPACTVGGLIVDTGEFAWHKSDRFDFSDFKNAGEHAYLAKLRKRLMADIGPSLSVMNAFLLLLGLETLSLRMERQCRNAETVAAFLREHPRVIRVLFPGLPDDEFHRITGEQFKGNFGSVLSFRLDSKQSCFRFLNALGLVKRATNLGDTKSLALHPASTIFGGLWPREQELLGVTDDMIRFSTGLEDPADITADLEQALGA